MHAEQHSIRDMFDRIAPTYDRCNRVLSFKQDIRWRNKVVLYLPKTTEVVLDVATGTGDLLIAMADSKPSIHTGIGVDVSSNMLSFAQEKVLARKLDDRLNFCVGDAQDLPFSAKRFDLVSIAFGIRNVINKEKALAEFARVLKDDGTLLILEFSLPRNYIIRAFYLFYFRYLLPALGGFLSKDKKAYSYLNKSVETFADTIALDTLIKQAGFAHVTVESLTFGIAQIYCARKS